MNIPKQVISFIESCPINTQPSLVFATFRYMNGQSVEVEKTHAPLWQMTLDILRPILAKREKGRLYRQRRKERLMRTRAWHDRTDTLTVETIEWLENLSYDFPERTSPRRR